MKRRARGFTLVELMVAVAIVGLLASVATPLFTNAVYRARQSERTTMVNAINNALNDYWVRNGQFPNGLPPASTMNLPSNPGFPLTSYKRSMRVGPWGDWSLLSIQSEGGVYYSYWCLVNAGDATAGGTARRRHLIWADRDLDGVGQQPFTTDIWTYDREALASHTFDDNAAPGEW
jgi:prepilin-type N-terminal cleavage/methylation domain-containing protein